MEKRQAVRVADRSLQPVQTMSSEGAPTSGAVAGQPAESMVSPSGDMQAGASAGDEGDASKPVPLAQDVMAKTFQAAPPADVPLDAERRRLWDDTKGWMDEVCKRLNLTLQEAAARANVRDAETFQQWHATGKPHEVTRQLRVWVKNLLKDAQASLCHAFTARFSPARQALLSRQHCAVCASLLAM